MSDPVVYKSENRDVLSAWESACKAIHEYVRQTQAVLDEAGAGDRPVWRLNTRWAFGKVRGVDCGDGLPKGWRNTSQGYAVPDRRIAAGRRVSDALWAVPYPGAPTRGLLGMPEDVCSGDRIYGPDVCVLGVWTVWVRWPVDPEKCEASFSSRSPAVDHSLWQRANLSEYYAAREARAGTQAA